jgi:hypothetical protein
MGYFEGSIGADYGNPFDENNYYELWKAYKDGYLMITEIASIDEDK